MPSRFNDLELCLIAVLLSFPTPCGARNFSHDNSASAFYFFILSFSLISFYALIWGLLKLMCSTAWKENDLAHLALRKWLPKGLCFPRLAGHLQSECHPAKVSRLPPLSKGSVCFLGIGGLILNIWHRLDKSCPNNTWVFPLLSYKGWRQITTHKHISQICIKQREVKHIHNVCIVIVPVSEGRHGKGKYQGQRRIKRSKRRG